jgi:hypothetical protein
MAKVRQPRPRGNFISEWFGQRIYPDVKMDARVMSGANWDRCPFLSTVKRANTKCVKTENAYGVCTINSVGDGLRKDWLVCLTESLTVKLLGRLAVQSLG